MPVVLWVLLIVGCQQQHVIELQVSDQLRRDQIRGARFTIETTRPDALGAVKLDLFAEKTVDQYLELHGYSRRGALAPLHRQQGANGPIIANVRYALKQRGGIVAADSPQNIVRIAAMTTAFDFLAPPNVTFIDIPGRRRRATRALRGGGRRIGAVDAAAGHDSTIDGAVADSAYVHVLRLEIVTPDGKMVWRGSAGRVDGREEFNLLAPMLIEAILKNWD